jgi:hypothetical protein
MQSGIIKAVVAIGATLLLSPCVLAGECLNYEPDTVTIEGSLSLKLAYGPPGFGEDPKHDAREDYLALTPDAPLCLNASTKPQTDNVAETDIRAMQLVFRDSAAFRQAKRLIGKPTSVTGTLSHSLTGHHHTTVLLSVREIRQTR